MPICTPNMVKRHLLTLFVLLSGLAALQAPAQAACNETMAAHARAIAAGCEVDEASHTACAFALEARAEATGRVDEALPSYEAATLPELLVPYVFGVERALE